MPDAAARDKRVLSDGESSQDELSRGRPSAELPSAESPSAESPSDAPAETIVPSAAAASIPPPSGGSRRRHRHRRRRIRPTYLVAAICAIVVAGLLLASQVSWPSAASPSAGSAAVATSSNVTASASYPVFATSSLPVVVGSPTALPQASSTSTASHSPVGIAANRIVIARLGINLRVVEGDGLDAPIGKAAHYPGTSWPGGGSNIYLYAHARDGMFISLWNAHIGDEIILTLVDGSQRRYLVSQIRPKVQWNDMSVLSATPSEQLTLQTCTSYQPTAPRFLVIAVPEQ